MFRWVCLISLISVTGLVFAIVQMPTPAQPQPVEFNHKLHVEYFLDGSHGKSMVSMHEQYLGEDVGDVKENLCTDCHGEFDEAVEDTPKIRHCAECHQVFIDRDWTERPDQKPCIGCHSSTVDSPRASIPNINTCAACHLTPQKGTDQEMKLLEFIKQERLIPWVRVYDYVPGDTVFSHERHAELGRIKCQECHGPVELVQHPLTLEVKLSMEDCMACHETHRADNDCLACHR
ncbi:MAG: cytochrome c3 family protein [Planctomycetota bacterium]|jgi:hypothetical protein